MSVYQLNISSKPGIEKTGETGTMSNPKTMAPDENPDTNKTTPAVDVVNKESAASLEPDIGEASDSADKTVVIDGSLSYAYTKALALVYAKNDPNEKPAIESQATDAALIASAAVAADEDLQKSDTDLYIYATDADTVNNSNAAETYDKLRLALDNNRIKNTIVAVEGVAFVSRKLAILEDYLGSKGIRVMHSRKAAMEQISSILGTARE